MSMEKMYFEAAEAVIDEIAKEKSLFSFRTIIKLIAVNSIARKI